jgi:hypothetical protein
VSITGYYTPLPGSATYYACPPGTYSSSAGSSNCADVAVGSYNPYSAATAPAGACSLAVEAAAANCVDNIYYLAPAFATTIFNSSVTSTLSNPTDVSVDLATGVIYISDTGHNRIRKILTSKSCVWSGVPRKPLY